MEQAISIKGLTKFYDNGFHALRGVDLDVAEGDFLPFWELMERVSPQRLGFCRHW